MMTYPETGLPGGQKRNISDGPAFTVLGLGQGKCDYLRQGQKRRGAETGLASVANDDVDVLSL